MERILKMLNWLYLSVAVTDDKYCTFGWVQGAVQIYCYRCKICCCHRIRQTGPWNWKHLPQKTVVFKHCYWLCHVTKFPACCATKSVKNVKCNSNYSVHCPRWWVTAPALYKWEKSQKVGKESEKRCDLRRQKKMKRERGSSDVRWKTVPQTSSCNRKRSVADSGQTSTLNHKLPETLLGRT